MRDYRSQGRDTDDRDLDAEAPVPGKRTLVEAALQGRGPRGRVPEPGRVPLTAGLTSPTASPMVFRHAADGAEPAADASDQVRAAQGAPGRPLPGGLARRLAKWLGPEAADIRVHDDDASAGAARSLRAEAYTVGRDVHFGGGHYDPESPRGQRLIAHEAAHAVGSSPSLALPTSGGALPVSRPGDSHEVHADGFADAFMARPDAEPAEPQAPAAQPAVIHRAVDVSATAVSDGAETGAGTDTGRPEARLRARAAGTQPPADGAPTAPPETGAPADPSAPEATQANPAPPAIAATGERRDAGPGAPAPLKAKPSTERGDDDKPAAVAAAGERGADLHAKRRDEIADAATRPAGLALPRAEAPAPRAIAADAAPQKAQPAPPPKGPKGAIQFAPADLRTMLPPIGPTESPDERRATERAFLAQYEHARSHATGSIGAFLASGNQQIGALSSLRPAQHRQIEGAERKALSSVDGAARAQVAAVRAAVARAIGQAQSAAGAARSQVARAHASAVASINASTEAARARIQDAFKTCGDSITQQETDQHAAVDRRYTTAQGQFRDAGSAAGGNAVGMANGMASGYLSQKINRDDSLLEGNVTDRRCEARAQAARDVGEAYRKGLVEEGGKQADKLVESKPADHNAVTGIATEVRATADKALKECLDNLDETHKESLAGADQARTQFLGQIDSALSGAVSGLTKHGQSQSAAIQTQASQLKQSIRQQAKQALAGVDKGLDGAMAGLRQSLDQLATGLRGKHAPDPDALDPAVVQAGEQLAQQIAKLRQGLTQGAAQAAQSLTGAATQGAQGIQQTGAAAAAAAADIAESSAEGMAQVGAGAQTALAQMAAGHQKAADGAAKAAEQTFPKVSQALTSAYNELGAKFEEGAQKNLGLIRDAFNDAVVSDLPAAVRKAADEAASKVEPRWKTVLKILVIIVIVIVIAVVLGPMVVGAVAGAAAALGAGAAAGTIGLLVGGAIVGALTGAVTTLADNAMNGRPLGTDFWKNVGMGAAGGLLGAGAGGLVGKLGPKLAGLGKVGTIAIDVVVDVAVDVVVNVAFGEFSLENLGMGAIMSVFMSGLGSTKAMEGLQGKMNDVGTRAGGKMVPPSLRRVDVSAPSPDTTVATPETGAGNDNVRPPDTGGNRGGEAGPRGDTAPPRQDTRGGDRPGPRQPAPETPARPPADRPAGDRPDAPAGDRPDAPTADGPRPDGPRPDGARPDTDGPRPDATPEGAKPGEPKPDAEGDRDGAPADRTPDEADTEAPPLAQPTRSDYSQPVGPGGYTTEAIPLVGRGDALGAAAANIQPIPGHIDVVVHGDGSTFVVRTPQGEIELDHRALARYLRSRGVTGDQNIRLISCRGGESPTAIAQHLANKLGVRVVAPSDTVWVHPDGRLSVGRNPDHETGGWNGFDPGNRFEPDVGMPGARPDEIGVDGPRTDQPADGMRPANDNQQPVAADREPKSNGPAIEKGYPETIEIDGKSWNVNDPSCPYYYYAVPGQPGRFDLKRRSSAPEGTPELTIQGRPPDIKIVKSDDARADKPRFPDPCTREDALALLRGEGDGDGSQSYRDFHAALERLGLDGLVIGRMPDPSGKTLDQIRHEIKRALRQDVLDAIIRPDGVELDIEASVLRLNEAIAGMNSSDRGSIAEDWCAYYNVPPGSHTQVPVPGIGADHGRRADFIDEDSIDEAGFITEMKSGDGPLDRDSLGQFEAYMHAIENGTPIGGRDVHGAVYVFTSPRGARANEAWIRAQLEAHPDLTIHVYDRFGRPHSFRARDQLEIDAYFNGYFDMEGSLPFFPSGPDPQRPRGSDDDDGDGTGIATDRPRGPDDDTPGPVAAGRDTPRPDDDSGGAAATPPVDPATLPPVAARDQVPDVLRQHQANGARIEVAGLDDGGYRVYDAVYPDGNRVRITEAAGPARPGTRGQRPATPEEVAALRVEMERARAIQNERCAQLTALVDTAARVEVDHAIAGAGIAATMDYNTLPPSPGMAAPGAAVTEIPNVLVIGGRESWRARAESLTQAAADRGIEDPLLGGGRIGQTPDNWEGPGFSRQPGEFTDDPSLLGRASDVGDAAFMTQFESGMAPYDGSVLRVEVNPNDGTWPSDRPLRLTVASTSHPSGEFHVYANTTDVATGRGAARSLEVGDGGTAQISQANLDTLLGDRRLVYYDTAFRHPSSGDVLVYGGGPTAVWAGGTAAEIGANVTVMGSLFGARQTQRAAQRDAVIDGPTAEADLARIDAEMTEAAFAGTRAVTQGRYFDDPNIAYTVGRLDDVRPGDPNVPGEAGKIMVLVDGTWRAYDQVAIALGQDPAGGGVDGGAPRPEGAPGIGQTVGHLELRMVFVDGRMVALESIDPPGAIRVIGAAIAESARAWVTPDQQDDFVRIVREQAAAAPPQSRTVQDSIYQIGESVPLANRDRPVTTAPPIDEPEASP